MFLNNQIVPSEQKEEIKMEIKHLPIVVGLLLGIFNFLEKSAISKYGIGYQEAVAVKFISAAIFAIIVICINSEQIQFTFYKSGYLHLVLSGILNVLAILILYYCFRFLDVSVVIPVYTTTTVIVISVLGVVLLAENFSLSRIIGLLFCIIGIALIIHKVN